MLVALGLKAGLNFFHLHCGVDVERRDIHRVVSTCLGEIAVRIVSGLSQFEQQDLFHAVDPEWEFYRDARVGHMPLLEHDLDDVAAEGGPTVP